jgi:hypothetical protein
MKDGCFDRRPLHLRWSLPFPELYDGTDIGYFLECNWPAGLRDLGHLRRAVLQQRIVGQYAACEVPVFDGAELHVYGPASILYLDIEMKPVLLHELERIRSQMTTARSARGHRSVRVDKNSKENIDVVELAEKHDA